METLNRYIEIVDTAQSLFLYVGATIIIAKTYFIIRESFDKTNDYKVMNVKKHLEDRENRKNFFKNLLG